MAKRLELKSFRVKQDLTQEEIAQRCNVTRCVYGKIEQGKCKGSPQFWVKLKEEFNLSADEMLLYMTDGKQ